MYTIYIGIILFLLGIITEWTIYEMYGYSSVFGQEYNTLSFEEIVDIFSKMLIPILLIPLIAYTIKQKLFPPSRKSSILLFLFIISFSLATILDTQCAGAGGGIGCDAGYPSMSIAYLYFIYIFIPTTLIFIISEIVKRIKTK